MSKWIKAENDNLPNPFISVLGYMTDAGDFPPVRECYTVDFSYGNKFYFPALDEFHPISHWRPMPEDIEEDPKGKWIEKEVRGLLVPCCSECGVDAIYETNFCPNCGVEME